MLLSETKLPRKKEFAVALIWLVALVLFVSLLPKKQMFKYDIQKGKEWLYEDLFAPFDFAIIKSDAEIKSERDSILRLSRLCFVMQDWAKQSKIVEFERNFDHQCNAAIDAVKMRYPHFQLSQRMKDSVLNVSIGILSEVYDNGICSYNEELDREFLKQPVTLINNKVSRIVSPENFFNLKDAQQYVSAQFSNHFSNHLTLVLLFENLNLHDYIVPNVEYNKDLTERMRHDAVRKVSTTRGMVQAGQSIISRGELIDSNKHRILESLKREYENMGQNTTVWLLLGQVLFVSILLFVLYLFLINYRFDVFESPLKLVFILGMGVITVAMLAFSNHYKIGDVHILPFAILPIVVRAFFSGRQTFFINTFFLLICGLLAPSGFEFIVMQMVAGAVIIFCFSRMCKRTQLALAVLLATLSYMATYTALQLLHEGNVTQIDWRPYFEIAINGALLFISYPLIYVTERMFRLVSNVTLLELSDTNQPLLRLLAEKAPGTFQHALQTANLGEEAIRKIGGNSLLMRVGALYHDIGKIEASQWFSENQSGQNPLDQLSNVESANIILNHVTKGIELARQYKLPVQITEFIATHHGTSHVQYFYNKEVNEKGIENVDIEKFTYKGKKPVTKECAVLMFADAVEAASRSLKEFSDKSIGNLVEKVIDGKIAENQMSNAQITFKDVKTIKQVFKDKLRNIYHTRIEYPRINKE